MFLPDMMSSIQYTPAQLRYRSCVIPAHAAPLHSCKYRWLHAPATNTFRAALPMQRGPFLLVAEAGLERCVRQPLRYVLGCRAAATKTSPLDSNRSIDARFSR